MGARILIGDCRERLKELPDDSVDSVVCDPPYHLTATGGGNKAVNPANRGQTASPYAARTGFMGQTWDGGDVAFDPDTWAEVLRVLKPGGHMVAFSGTRTYHRMVCAIEDAGFEIRDQLAWVYGSGFPKSLDVSKAIDKAAGEKGAFGEPKSAAHAGWIERGRMRGDDGHEGYQRPWMKDEEAVANNARQYLPATEAAQQWSGWGTALKPSWEPICLARKPLIGSVASNVLTHGTGALNIDGCRIGNDERTFLSKGIKPGSHNCVGAGWDGNNGHKTVEGRWPANLCHDGSDEVLAGFPDVHGAGAAREEPGGGEYEGGNGWGNIGKGNKGFRIGDSGSAARFFYCAKATTEERGQGNNHPTVKPVALMRWLCRLITPKGGTVLDPFMGSGSTGLAAFLEQFEFIGCEMSPEYAEIARTRLSGDLFASVKVV